MPAIITASITSNARADGVADGAEREQRLAEAFALRPGVAYLNHAGVAPWPRPTVQAIGDFADENMRVGALGYDAWSAAAAELRELLRRLINAETAAEIALVKNTSEGLSFVAHGLEWEADDNVVVGIQEFPSNRIVWESLRERFGVEVRAVDLYAAATPERALLERLDARTRLVAVSSIQYATGYRMDLEELGAACRAVGALLCVDAIQSLGAAPVDVQAAHVDFLAADGHKWMLAPEGIGCFYCRRRHLNALRLHQYGWGMLSDPGDYDALYDKAGVGAWREADDARRFECGSLNTLGIYALRASLGLLFDTGLDRVFDGVAANVSYLADNVSRRHFRLLTPRQAHRRGGILTLQPRRGEAKKLYKQMQNAGVVCALRGGGIRLSPHFYTPRAALDQALECLHR